MKRICCLVVLCCLCVGTKAWAGFSVDLENQIVEGIVTPNLNIYETHDLTKAVQLFGYGLISELYCEGYAGAAF